MRNVSTHVYMYLHNGYTNIFTHGTGVLCKHIYVRIIIRMILHYVTLLCKYSCTYSHYKFISMR